jgi:type VI secretion system secreted protein VgrG
MTLGLSQKKRIASFKTPFGDDYFVICAFSGVEGLGELYGYEIDALSEVKNADLAGVLGEECFVALNLRGGETRHFSGIATEARWLGVRGDFHAYRFTLRPWLWLLSQRSDSRIFHNKTAPEVIKAVFGREAKSNFDDRLTESYQVMEYCVQYQESDLAFVLRLMEHHGMYFYFKHDSGGHKLVLSDSKSAHDLQRAPTTAASGGDYVYLPPGRPDRRNTEYFSEWYAERRLRTGRVEVNDYDFKQSTADLKRSKEDGLAVARRYEVFEYPGKYTERSDGERFAEILVQASQAQDERRYATGEAPSLFPGALFQLAGHDSASENNEHLVIRASHQFSDEEYRSGAAMEAFSPYQGTYECMQSERRFRSPRVTARPLIHGPQTAKVVGEARSESEEIDVDEHGCILVQFHWDRDDKTTSRRVRVAQVWSGKGWGGQFIPRIGQEVVVEFLDGDPDQPLVIGTVYNDRHRLPYDLPADKTQSGLRSNSSKGGSGFNELKFEDKKDEEKIEVHAEKDLNSVIKHLETREIGQEFPTPKGQAARATIIRNGDDVLKIDQGSLNVEAMTSIVLKVGLSTITIEPNSVTVDSPQVTIKSISTDIKGDATVVVKGQMITLN